MASPKKPEDGEKKKSSKKAAITKSNQEKRNKNKKISNGSTLLSSSSSRDSKEVIKIEEDHEGSKDSPEVIKIEEEDDETKSGAKNQSMKNTKSKKSRKNGPKNSVKEKDDDDFDGATLRFPMARIKRIIKSEDSHSLLNQDVVFLVNKATEKFLEQFCEEAHQCSVKDRKKAIAYKHLSTVVGKRRRFDFLSDFVPEKLKARNALEGRKLAETGQL